VGPFRPIQQLVLLLVSVNLL